MKIDFTGKTAIITGAGSGLCKCTALLFADLGADVWVADLNEENGRATVKEIEAKGRKSGFVKTDISSFEQVKNLYDTVAKAAGKIDIVVNGAGMGTPGGILDMDPKTIQKMGDVNIAGTSYSCKLALEHMIPNKEGKILNISSAAGRRGQDAVTLYAATKAGIINLTQGIALTAASHNINVNAICPGIIRTKMWEDMLDFCAEEGGNEEREEIWEYNVGAEIPFGRPQEPLDIAWGVAFLCSEYARNITGQTLNIDGGMRMN